MEETPQKKIVSVFCPSCGFGFTHQVSNAGKAVGGGGDTAAGALLGAKIGIVAGPLGAMAGTVPGAILGALFGKKAGGTLDNPVCPQCSVKFPLPSR
jgi:hypothetical protein